MSNQHSERKFKRNELKSKLDELKANMQSGLTSHETLQVSRGSIDMPLQ
jgi:hypothetical protein